MGIGVLVDCCVLVRVGLAVATGVSPGPVVAVGGGVAVATGVTGVAAGVVGVAVGSATPVQLPLGQSASTLHE